MLRKIFLILSVLSFTYLPAQTGNGTISGSVVAKKSSVGLPGVNIIIKGTYYGTATDGDGNFEIRNISPGSYDLEVTMIGYKVHLQAGFKVERGETNRLNIEMEETVLAIGQEVVVIGEKPILQVDQTSSSIRLSREDLAGKIAENVMDIIAEQVGVVESDNEIHIRGGRVDESQFIVDGLSLKDPLSGSANNLYVNPNAISELEFISGGFNAEYGQAMSGIIDVKLKEGYDEYEGSLTYKSDHLGSLIKGFKTNIAEFTLGGLEPTTSYLLKGIGLDIPGNIYFFISGY
ncbi:MAG: TonB-dependent receptor, partial [Candidatus Marinimicrobia bacterium]|nr:TonB-dependent receptor [Candidatus Neomarinimicrobiota bacterium]